MNCQICQRPPLAEIEEFSQLPRVTSDCKAFRSGGSLSVCLACGATQKFADQTWLKETREIYENYELYQLSEGAEQIIYVNGTARARSRLLLDFLLRSWSLPATGKLIDIGCGNGAALANFSSALPGWKLYGTE